MPLYQNTSGSLKSVQEQPFKLEKDIQKLIEDNLELLMNLEFVKSEFIVKNKRIDTLAYDQQTRGFVIIEYKRDRNISVVDQGFAYLSLMLENKAEFIIEYNESLHKQLKRDDVDWSQCRVVFVTPSFTENQKLATNFQDIAIELWEVKKYEHDLISFNQIKKSSRESVKQIARQESKMEQVTQEIKVYTEEDHLARCSESIQELFEELKSRILLLDDLEVSPTKFYIGFKLNNKVITDVEFLKGHIKQRVNLKSGQLDDPKGFFRDVSNVGHWGLGDYEAKYDTEVDLDYLMSLIKQSYTYHKQHQL